MITDARGKQRRRYRVYATPWEVFQKLPKASRYLKAGLKLRRLRETARLESATDAARGMQEAKRILFADVHGTRRSA